MRRFVQSQLKNHSTILTVTTIFCSINFDRRDLPMRSDILPILMIASLGHALAAFVNGEYVGKNHIYIYSRTINFLVQEMIHLSHKYEEIFIVLFCIFLSRFWTWKQCGKGPCF